MSSPIRPPLTVETIDGATEGRPINTIKVSNGTLSVSGTTATITTDGGGGGTGTGGGGAVMSPSQSGGGGGGSLSLFGLIALALMMITQKSGLGTSGIKNS